MRGARDVARLVAVAVVVLSALTLVGLAASSQRAPTLAPKPVATSPSVIADAPLPSPTIAPDGGRREGERNDLFNSPSWVIWAMWVVLVAPLLLGLVFAPAIATFPGIALWLTRRGRKGEPPEVEDEVAPPPLAEAVEQGLRELDQGGAGEGVVACWVLLERAAADAGTHRAAPETASELVGRLIDRHPVSSAPLLQLAELYREARYSRHELPESARTEARAALEQLRSELEASPVGHR
jgi:Domain of unknown function (DUF4129)